MQELRLIISRRQRRRHPVWESAGALRGRGRWLAALILVLVFGWSGLAQSNVFLVNVVLTFLIMFLLLQALQIMVFYTGQMSLAQGAIYGVGAYTTVFVQNRLGLPPEVAGIFAIGAGAMLGVLVALPLSRLRQHYLAMATLAVQVILSELFVQISGLTGGSNGTSLAAPIAMGWALGGGIAACDLLVVLVVPWLLEGRLGHAMRAVKTDEMMARSVGIGVMSPKTYAVVLASGLTALAGFFFAQFEVFVAPSEFSLSTSIIILAAMILGGSALGMGPLIGAGVYEGLNAWLSAYAGYSVLLFGFLLVVLLMFNPDGVTGLVRAGWRRIAGRSHAGMAETWSMEVDAAADRGDRLPSIGFLQAERGSANLLEVVGVSKSFGGAAVLDDVHLRVNRPGEVLAVIGGNGAGKTTLLNVITGVVRADRGTVCCRGQDITGMVPEQLVRYGVARTFQTPRLDLGQSCIENVVYGMHLHGWSGGMGGSRAAVVAEAESILEFLGLGSAARRPASEMSYGARKVLELGRCLACRPWLVLLDEPAAGLSVVEEDWLRSRLDACRRLGLAIVIVDHRMRLIFGLADNVLVLDSGRELFAGTVDSVRSNQSVIESYLGRSAVNRVPQVE